VVVVERHLGHDDHKRPALGMDAQGRRQADLRLVQAFHAAFARAMEKQDHRPLLALAPVFRQVHHVPVGHAVHADDAIEKAGVLRVARCPGRRSPHRK
jgi:hypothetical protein